MGPKVLLLPVHGPVPGLQLEVEQPEGFGVVGQPPEALVALRDDQRTIAGEVDRQAALVHRRTGTSRRRSAVRRGHFVDRVLRCAAVGTPQSDLLFAASPASAASS